MLHACVKKFDATGTVEIFLGTKQGLNGSFTKSFMILNTIIFTDMTRRVIEVGTRGPQPSHSLPSPKPDVRPKKGPCEL